MRHGEPIARIGIDGDVVGVPVAANRESAYVAESPGIDVDDDAGDLRRRARIGPRVAAARDRRDRDDYE